MLIWPCRAVLVVMALGMSVVAVAEEPAVTVGAGGGVYKPYDGSTGFNILAYGLFRIAENWDIGGEIEYRSFAAEVLDVDDVGIDTVVLRFLSRYVFVVGPVNPYIGAALGIDLNIIDSGKIERERPGVSTVSDFGVGIGILGLAGLDVPIANGFTVFAEGRAGYDVQVTSEDDDIGADNLGGITGMGGVRYSF